MGERERRLKGERKWSRGRGGWKGEKEGGWEGKGEREKGWKGQRKGGKGKGLEGANGEGFRRGRGRGDRKGDSERANGCFNSVSLRFLHFQEINSIVVWSGTKWGGACCYSSFPVSLHIHVALASDMLLLLHKSSYCCIHVAFAAYTCSYCCILVAIAAYPLILPHTSWFCCIHVDFATYMFLWLPVAAVVSVILSIHKLFFGLRKELLGICSYF